MNYKKLKERYEKVKANFFHKEHLDLLDDLNELYDSRISIITSCKDCDNRMWGICIKHNDWIEDIDTIPDYCRKESMEDLIKLLDKIKDENYVKAHFKR